MAIDPFLSKGQKFQPEQKPSVQDNSVGQQSQQSPQKTAASTNSTVSVVQKKGSKVSMKTFLLGCVIFLLLFVGLAAGVLFLIIQNPDQFASIGLDRATIQRLLQVFTLLFFGFLFFTGFGIMLVNAYRFTTVKNKPRLKYGIGSFLGLVVLLLSIAGGAVTLRYIQDIDLSGSIDTSSVVTPYLKLKTGPQNLLANPQPSLIAPLGLYYELNTSVFDRQIFPTLGAVDIQSMQLDCGADGQVLNLNLQTAVFDGICSYYTRGTYEPILSVTTIDRQTAEIKTTSFPIGALSIPTEIAISGPEEVRYSNGEVIVGRVPRKVQFDARDVFTDLALKNYVISWDVNDDGVADSDGDAIFSYVYNYPQVYNVNVRFPELDNYVYTFPLRVEQSDVPVCKVNILPVKGTQYQFQVEFIDRSVPVSSYGFTILDVVRNETLASQTETVNSTSYTFPGAGTYAIRVQFVTTDGKQGNCESDNFAVGSAAFVVDYDLAYKSPDSPSFREVSDSSAVFRRGDSIVVQELPTIVRLTINSINPQSPDAVTKVFLNETAILSFDTKSYEMRIDQEDQTNITIQIVDEVRGTRADVVIPVVVEQAPIVGKFIVKPDTVGIEPFEAQFDVSTTTLTDASDSIVFFTRDFGDGEVQKNTSQSIVSHIYRYDYEAENGTYTPRVTVQTKKGRSLTFGPETDIIVRKALQGIAISVDSHPAQVARVGETVEYSLDISGLPESIIWDFGDDNTLECEGRQCVSTSHIYVNPGTYTVTVTINYDGQPSVTGKITIKVNS